MNEDIVTRLRNKGNELNLPAFVRGDCCSAAEELVHLRAALALAVGELSTHGQYAVWAPDQLMQHFLEEARRG